MISSTFVAVFAFAMPIVSGLVAFGFSVVRSSTLIFRPRWEIVASAALVIVLMTLFVLMLSPHWSTRYIALSTQRAKNNQEDAAETLRENEVIAKYEAIHRTPPDPVWQRQWEAAEIIQELPLQPINAQQAAEFIDTRLASYDYAHAMDARMASNVAKDYCELRQWDVIHGNWETPLLLWFIHKEGIGSMSQGRAEYFGLAILRGGDVAGLAGSHGFDAHPDDSTSLLETLFYNRTGGQFSAFPIDRGAPTPNTYVSFSFVSDDPIQTDKPEALQQILLKALPDGRFELRRQFLDNVERYVVRAEDPVAILSVQKLIDKPRDSDDDPGFPVAVEFHGDASSVDTHRFSAFIAKDRRHYKWQTAHPNIPPTANFMMRNAGVEPNINTKISNSDVTVSKLRWTYETNFIDTPMLYGEVRCFGKLPGEMKAIMARK